MAQRGTVEVIDKAGWHKTFPLNKSIVYIGSDTRNDVTVETWHGSGLQARHLQMVPSPTSSLGYRLVNMGTSDLLLGETGTQTLPPRAATDLADGDIMRLGELTFIFRCNTNGQDAGAATTNRPITAQSATSAAAIATVAASARKANPIGLSLVLPAVQLVPGQTIDGAIVIKNQGDKTGVQFKIEVDGFDTDAYDLGSAPILFPGVEKQVLFRLRHPQKPNPPAGNRRLTVRVTAPNAYPGEVATASQVLEVVPYIKHRMSLEITS